MWTNLNTITANEHNSQNSELYFRTGFHFQTNHEAAGSRTGVQVHSGMSHETGSFPRTIAFLTLISYRAAIEGRKNKMVTKKLHSWWLFLDWQGQTFRRRCIKWKYNLKTWWHTFLAHFRLHKRIWLRINLRKGWYLLHNIIKPQDWDFATSVNFPSCPAQLETWSNWTKAYF